MEPRERGALALLERAASWLWTVLSGLFVLIALWALIAAIGGDGRVVWAAIDLALWAAAFAAAVAGVGHRLTRAQAAWGLLATMLAALGTVLFAAAGLAS